MGTNVVVKEIKGHKIASNGLLFLYWLYCSNDIVARYATNLNRKSGSWRNLSTRESGF